MTALDSDQREQFLYELDAIAAHLYGLTEDQLAHIFKTYRLNWDYSLRLENKKNFIISIHIKDEQTRYQTSIYN